MVQRTTLIGINTHFILVITDDNGYEHYFLSNSYEKCYKYLLHEYFDDNEDWLKESEDYNEDDAWYDADNCWHFRIEQAKTI